MAGPKAPLPRGRCRAGHALLRSGEDDLFDSWVPWNLEGASSEFFPAARPVETDGRSGRCHYIEHRNPTVLDGRDSSLLQEQCSNSYATGWRVYEQAGHNAQVTGDVGAADDRHRCGMGLGVESDVADHGVVDLSDPRGDSGWFGEEAEEVVLWQIRRVAIKVSNSRRDFDQGLEVLAEARPDFHVSIIVDAGSTTASHTAQDKHPNIASYRCP